MHLLRQHRAAAFVILTYALSAYFYVRIASDGKLKALPILGLMWCPGIAAMILRLLLQGDLRGTGWCWRAPGLQVFSYVLPPVLGLAVYGTVWITGIGAFNSGGIDIGRQSGSHVRLPIALLLLATLGIVQGMVFGLGEEIGWRGFLVPELAKSMSFTRTAWLSGAAWAVYHYPLILFAEYHSGTPKWFALPVFTWMVLALAFVFAWVRLRSGSVWTAVILHASHNLFVQQIFDPLTTDRGVTKYVTTEFGIGLALAYTAVAWDLWRRRNEVERVAATSLQ